MYCYNRIHRARAVTDTAWYFEPLMRTWVRILAPMKTVTVTHGACVPARNKLLITGTSDVSVIRIQFNRFFNLTHNSFSCMLWLCRNVSYIIARS